MNLIDINSHKWAEIVYDHTPISKPITAHLPIQLPHSSDLIHVDSAFNVCRRRIYPGLSIFDINERNNINRQETFQLQFAFGELPFVPDFHCTKVSFENGIFPPAVVDFFAWDILYSFRYFCFPSDVGTILCVQGRVTNEGQEQTQVDVRAYLNVRPENELFAYHYVPFYFDATKWSLPLQHVELSGDILFWGDKPVGIVRSGEFSLEQEKLTKFEGDWNKKFHCASPYYVSEVMRIHHVCDTLHFRKELLPGQSCGFEIALSVDYEHGSNNTINAIRNASAYQSDKNFEQVFTNIFSGKTGELKSGACDWGKLFVQAQLSTHQLLLDFPCINGLIPTQGGTSERHFVWTWEAVTMLRPMLRLGHFEVVRKSLDYIFSLQNSGFPPDGKFTDTDGAIGTTGPRWANSTGAALVLASEYYIYTGDKSFLQEYLLEMIRAGRWIIRQLDSTRQPGNPGFGLMPFACATDGDEGLIVSFTDSYTWMGLDLLTHLLEKIQDVNIGEFRKRCNLYRKDLNDSVVRMARPDGYIERKILTGHEQHLAHKFENVCGASHLAFVGILDSHTNFFNRYVEYIEKNVADGFFMGAMDREVLYVGIGEWVWQDVYLKRHEFKKAFAVARAFWEYGVTDATFQVQERVSKVNPAFVPWQPNGSGNGKILDIIINSFYFDAGESVIILGGIPWPWLTTNPVTSLKNLYTEYGRLDIVAEKMNDIEVKITVNFYDWTGESLTLELPDHFLIKSASVDFEDNQINVKNFGKQLEIVIADKKE